MSACRPVAGNLTHPIGSTAQVRPASLNHRDAEDV
jgi:hypothetical protein